MATSVQFIVDNKGHKKSVIVPYKEWEELNQKYEKLNNKVQILTGIQDAMMEVDQAKKKPERNSPLLPIF